MTSTYTIAYWEANQSSLDSGPAFNIGDTAANISGALNALNADSNILQIRITDNTAVVFKVGQLINDTNVLSKLINDDNSPAHVNVRDTAQHIANNFASIATEGQVSIITVSDNAAVVLSASQITNNASALSLIHNADLSPANVTAKDSAAHIAADGTLDTIEANLSIITSVVISNSTAMTLTAAQIANDAGALAIVTNNNLNPVTFKVSDTGAHIGTYLDALEANTQITAITDSDNAAITLNIAQFTNDADALALVVNADSSPVSFIVNDTAANIAGAFTSLNGNANVTKIVVNDNGANEVTLTAAAAVADTTAESHLFKANGTTAAHVAVSDTAANISTNFDQLNGNSHVDKITISPSAALTLTVTQIVNDTTALGEITNGSYSINASGTAAQITTNFDALAANSHIAQVTVTDNAEITVTVSQLTNQATFIAELVNQNASTVHVIVADGAAVIGGPEFDALNANSTVNKIIVTDSATNEVAITVASAAADSTALGELFQANGTTPAHVKIFDTAAHIAAGLDALNGNTHVDKIVVSDSATNEVTITVAQLADTTALGELKQADGSTQANVAVNDTAAAISGAFDALNSNAQVDKIVISPTADLTLSATQVANDTAAFAKISGSYSVDVSDTASAITTNLDALQANGHVVKVVVTDSATHEVNVTVAQLTSDAGILANLFQADTTTPAHVAVNDTAAHVGGAEFDALNNNGQVDKIIVSDSGSNEVTITASQAATDGTALGELFQSDGVTHAHVAVSDLAANITSALDALSANTHVDKIIVSDSALKEVQVTVAQITSDATALAELFNTGGLTHANVTVDDTAVSISGAFDALNGNTQVNKILVDNGPHHAPNTITEVTISVHQQQTDTTALAELFQTDGTTQAHVAVSDTAVNISAALDELNDDSQVDHIIISDEGPITVTVAQALSDSTALGELENGDASPVTLVVQDNAAAISAAFDALNAIATISSIVIFDNAPLNLTAVNIGTDSHALSILSNFDASGVEINVTDIAANISLYLDALQANNDIISITVSDSAPITVTVAQINTDSVVLGELVNADNSDIQLTVRDTNTHIRQSLAALNQNLEVTSIVISNNLALNLTVTQYSNNSRALSILHNANNSPYQLTISDNAAHISGVLDTLNGDTHVTSITVTDSAAITLTVAQITSDATALGELHNSDTSPYKLSVHDTAVDVSAAFDALNGNSHVVQIVVTDEPTNKVTLSASEAVNDTTALADLFQSDGTTQAHVNVNDTAANITTYLDSLGSTQIDKLIVNDSGSNEVAVTVAQLTTDSAELLKLYDSDGTTPANVVVNDTAANITTALDTLNTNTQVNRLVVNDSDTHEVQVSIAQISSDATALAELYNSDGTTPANVAVADTAAAVTTALDTLNANTQVNKIIVSDSGSGNEVVVSVLQLSSDATALGELVNSDGTTPANIVVNDTAADIQGAEFDALNSNTQVNKIVVSDSATNQVTLLAAQIHNDTTALAELFNADGTTPAHVLVSDTAANISTYFADLNSSQVSKIIITDSAGHEVTITVAELTSDFHAIGVLFQSDGVTHALVAVSDTAADISAGISSLNSNTHVDKIFISDGNPLTLTVAQVTNDTVALGRIQGPYQVSIHDTAGHVSANLDALENNNSIVSVVITDNKAVVVSVAQLSSDTNVLSVMTDANNPDGPPLLRVVDTAAHIQAALGNLQVDLFSDNFQSVVISDNLAISVSVGQMFNDEDVLFLLRNADGSNAQLTVSDTAAHVQNNIDFLQAFNGSVSAGSQHVFITSIVITNSQQMTFSAQQIHDDENVLGLVTNLNTGPVTFKVVDNAADITTYLDDLQDNGEIGTITVTDNGAIGVSVLQLSRDASVLSNLHNQDNSPYELVVTDAAANITAALAALHGNSHIEKIIVSDSSSNEVHFTKFQLTNDANVLNELYNANGTTHASVVLADSGGHISTMTVTDIQNLAGEHVNHIDSTTDAFTWNVAQYQALGTVTLTDSDNVTLKDSASTFAGLTVSGLGALHAHGIDNVALTGSGTFALARWEALTENGLNVTTTGAHIQINGTNAGEEIDTVGTGSFTLVGGKGADAFYVNSAAHDTFVYNSGIESTSTGYDTIHGFNGATDTIVSPNAINAFDGVLNHSTVNTATFDADMTTALAGHMGADEAIVVRVTSGTLSGHTFLVVDENGVAGYQSGDLVIDVTGGTHFASLTAGSFVQLS